MWSRFSSASALGARCAHLWRGIVLLGLPLLAFLLMFSLPPKSHAQQECLTFDDTTANHCANWQTSVAVCIYDKQPPNHASPAMRFEDGSGGPSFVQSTMPFFQGNWLTKAQRGCLCFDWMLDLQWPYNPVPSFSKPNVGIWQGGDSPLSAAIRAELIALSGAPPMQEDVWYRICLPIDSCRNGQLPSDGRFTWQIVNKPSGMSDCDAWNTLITSVTGIYLGTDYHGSPSELVYFDNFCFRCTPSDPAFCRRFWFASTVERDSNCCQLWWSVPAEFVQRFPLLSIQYSVTGGYVDTLYAIGCPYTTQPANVHGSISGTFTFSGGGCNQALTIVGGFTPTTSSGNVTVRMCVNIREGSQIIECCDSVVIGCPRAPITKCDSLAVTPFIWSGLNLSGRTFTIFNQKVPPSPIQKVLISFDPPPCSPPDWNGGGLVVDGGSRSWGVANSGTPKYSQISMACPPAPPSSAPQGAAANNTVRFNLGVDYTCNWTGSVTLTVIHCDGDTCVLTYPDWCAMPEPVMCKKINWPPLPPVPLRPPITPRAQIAWLLDVEIDTALVPGRPELHACHCTVVPVGRGWDVVGASVDDGLTPDEREAGRGLAWRGAVALNKAATGQWALVQLGTCKWEGPYPDTIKPWLLRVTLASTEARRDTPRVAVTFYDADGNPIASDTAKAAMKVTSVPVEVVKPAGGSSGILQVVPNPAAEEVRVEYVLARPSEVTVELCDLLGKCQLKAELGWMPAGPNSFGMSTADLPTGSYILRLRTSDGVLTAPLRIVR